MLMLLFWARFFQLTEAICPRKREIDISEDKVMRSELRQGRMLGEGSSSQVFQVEHVATGGVFAMKVYDKQKVERLDKRHNNTKNSIMTERASLLTAREAKHPGLVRLYHTFQDHTMLYLLMDFAESWVEFWDLLAVPRPADIPGDTQVMQVGLMPTAAKYYFEQIVSAVSAMHLLELVHRDIKPENMMVCTATGRLRLIDFGTCKNLCDASINGPDFVGTPEYMCPEAIENGHGPHGPVEYGHDLWSLGCVLLQLLSGVLVFKSRSEYLTFERIREASSNT